MPMHPHPDSNKPCISVIIPHFNDLEGLQTCLQRLAQQTLDRTQFEVIVADNNSAIGMEAVRAVVGDRAIVVPAVEQGAAAARNAAVASAQGEILAFIDSDCRPAVDWLEQGLKAMAEAEVIGGCMVVSADGDRLHPVEAFEAVFAFNNEAYVKHKGFSVTANLFVRRAVFEAVGGFRVGVSEDKDWCLRAGAMGYRIGYAAQAVVEHPARQNWTELAKKWQRLIREEYRLIREHRWGQLKWLVRSWAVLVSPVAHLFVVLRCHNLRWQDKLNAIAILFRIRLYRFIEAHRVFVAQL
ncbi:MAG: glycosyltransferase [Leptolyngbyaceae cyanobacterium SL_7_1]|nr:glycosyltransferase [Leptolyngbyaceae cyanobacterium SL_7_1]